MPSKIEKYSLLTFALPALVIHVLLGLGVFYAWYGSGAIYHPDTLQSEELFSDIFLHGGALKQWSLPYSSYWLDFGLYALIRFFTPGVQTATPLFSAFLAILLALAAWYAVWPLAKSPAQKRMTALACCALSLFICAGNPYSFLMSRVLFHVLTAVFVCVSIGCLIRILCFSAGIWTYSLLFCSIALSSASDTMFVLWFIIPASGVISALFLLQKITLRRAAALIAFLGLAVLAGKAADAFCKPEYSQVAGHVRPAFRRILPTLGILLQKSGTFFSDSPFTAAFGAASLSTFALAVRSKQSRLYLALIAFIAVAAIAGYAINGATAIWYIVPLWSFLLLLTLSFALAQLPPLPSGFACAVLIIISVAHIWPQLTQERREYRPLYTDCLANVTREHGIREVLALNDFAKEIQYLSGLDITAAPVRFDYFLFARSLTTPHGKKFDAPLLVLPRIFSDEMFRRETLYAINGQPARVIECPGTDVSLYFYPNRARIGSMADYFADTGGRFEKSFPDRDMTLWEGTQKIAGAVLGKVSSLYRLNRQWIVFHLDAKPETLRGKSLTVFMTGNKDNPPRRLAGTRLSSNGSSPLDFIWKKLIWSNTFTFDEENTLATPDGKGSWFFFRSPDRETKKWLMLSIALDDTFIRLF